MYCVLTTGFHLNDNNITEADLVINATNVGLESNGTDIDPETNATKLLFYTHVKENAGQIKFWLELISLIGKDNLNISWCTRDETACEHYNNVHAYQHAINYMTLNCI